MSTSGLSLQNVTAGNSGGSGFRVVNFSSGTVRNLVSYNSGNWGINSNLTPSYTDTYLATNGLYNQTTPTVGVKTTNPLADGTPASIKYLPRIETGSVLKGTGYGGADYGANIIYRYGTDGTFYGDSGYNTLSATSLWPWPNEARIKTDMAAYSVIGFCANTDNPRTNTGKITLSSYVWEYLGNTDATAALYAGGVTPPTMTGVSIVGGGIR